MPQPNTSAAAKSVATNPLDEQRFGPIFTAMALAEIVTPLLWW